jgi:uncharacterized protein YdeI (YjbR/CyaY-like superfamily)
MNKRHLSFVAANRGLIFIKIYRSIMPLADIKTYYAKDRKTWRKWLEKHHETSPGIWLIYYKKDSGKSRVPYSEAVEEALCFGWIDSTSRPIDEEKYMQLFTPRKPKSEWSRLNKQRIEQLTEQGLMMPAGLEKIEIAKRHGAWTKIDHVEDLVIPPDLAKAFKTNKGTKAYFDALSKTGKKGILHWLGNARREETRATRIADIMHSFIEGRLPHHFKRPEKKAKL